MKNNFCPRCGTHMNIRKAGFNWDGVIKISSCGLCGYEEEENITRGLKPTLSISKVTDSLWYARNELEAELERIEEFPSEYATDTKVKLQAEVERELNLLELVIQSVEKRERSYIRLLKSMEENHE